MTYQELKDALGFVPVVENDGKDKAAHYVVGGMGGSALPGNALRFLEPMAPVLTHRDYGAPESVAEDAHYIAISYSGNTAETISFAETALERGIPLSVITAGGKLAELATREKLRHAIIPEGMQPRNALFHQLRALLEITGHGEHLAALSAVTFDAGEADKRAAALAEALSDALPIFYSSRVNGFLAWVAKIQINETAKMPAFANVFPEMNHNEMQSFDSMAPGAVAELSRFVMLHDKCDDERIGKRMEVFGELMRERGRRVERHELGGTSRAEVLAEWWFIAHRTAQRLAAARGVDPEAVPLVEEFKKRL